MSNDPIDEVMPEPEPGDDEPPETPEVPPPHTPAPEEPITPIIPGRPVPSES